MHDWSSLSRRLQAALSADSSAVYRLSKAGTSVAFFRAGEPERAVTLLLDRRPPELVEGSDAEVHVEFEPLAAERFARGELVVSTALLEGGARAAGPIRRYLAVDPVVRGLLREVRCGEHAGERRDAA